MAKARSGNPKAKPAAKTAKPEKGGLLKRAADFVSKAATQLKKPAGKSAAAAKAATKPEKAPKAGKAAVRVEKVSPKAEKAPAKAAAKAAPPAKEGKGAKATKTVPPPPPPPEKPTRGKGKKGDGPVIPAVEKPRPRSSKLPPAAETLTKREMEQILTVGQGRGVGGEGSVKGRLVVKDHFPYLHVVGRDKRELVFLLQGPDQEVLPAYLDHKVSVSGLIRKTHNYGGTIDVRKYSAKKPEAEVEVAAEPAESKLRFLSPGELVQITSAGMGAGMKGFASIRGSLEMSGEDFVLVVSHAGTRQQVSFTLEGKNAKGMRKHLGHTLQVTGVVDKQSGWGGRIEVENYEPRPTEVRISRDNLEVVTVEGEDTQSVDVKLNHGLSVRLPERVGYHWAIEPTTSKRVVLREANFEPATNGPSIRDFFFTPRNPGTFEVEFFLAKAHSPSQVLRSYKLVVNVKQ